MRCIHLEGRHCFNELHKRQLQNDIGSIIDKVLAEEDPDLEENGKPVKLHSTRRDKLYRQFISKPELKTLLNTLDRFMQKWMLSFLLQEWAALACKARLYIQLLFLVITARDT